MEINRRQFVGHLSTGAAAVALGLSSMTLSGCNVITDIENWIPTAESGVNAILAILTANGVPITAAISAGVALVETALNDLIAAVKEYQSITPPPVGAAAKIEAALQAIADQFGAFVGQLSGTASKVLNVIVALVKIIVSTIGGFVSELPTSAKLLAKLNSNPVVAAPPVKRTRRAFKKDWNSTADAGAKTGVACPPAAYLPVSFWEHF